MAGKAISAEHIAHGCAVRLRFAHPNSWHLPEQHFVHPVIGREQKSSHAFEQGLLSHLFRFRLPTFRDQLCVCVCVYIELFKCVRAMVRYSMCGDEYGLNLNAEYSTSSTVL
jgi:hypothetical protein